MVTGYGKHIARRIVGLVLMLALAGASGAWAQKAAPEFEVDAVSVRGNGATASRVDVYTKLPYSSLRFLSTPNGFTARYGITAEVYTVDDRNRTQTLVQSRIWESSVVVPDFYQTQTDQVYDRTLQTLDLVPGRYVVQLQVEDQSSRETFVRDLPIEVRDLSRPLAVSDLILIDAFNPTTNSITPSIGNRLGSEQSSFRLFYEIYSDRAQRVRITREVLRARKGNGGSAVKSILGIGRDDETPSDVSYQEIEPQRLQRGRNQFVVEVPMGGFKVGDYVARVKVQDEAGRTLDVVDKEMSIHWSGLAEHVRDLNEAIAQLAYIAKDKDLSYIREGRTEGDRRDRFLEFWRRRDPTPGTERNERMEEYYYRIAFANRQYGNFIAGWRTDRGHVMVLFGEPDYVERHPYNYDTKPYEVWYYYGIGRRFIFIDKTGFGDYELMVPVWDERNRLR